MAYYMGLVKTLIKKTLILLRAPKHLIRGTRFSLTSTIEPNVCMINSRIGKYTYIGMGSYYNHVIVGNYCSMAGGITIGAMEHSHWAYSTSSFLSDEGYDDHMTKIGNDVWIGTHCIVRQGVTIGDGAVIGANSFVNRDIPPYAIAFGTPVKVYKYRFDEETIAKLRQSRYWDNSPKEAKRILNNLNTKFPLE